MMATWAMVSGWNDPGGTPRARAVHQVLSSSAALRHAPAHKLDDPVGHQALGDAPVQ